MQYAIQSLINGPKTGFTAGFMQKSPGAPDPWGGQMLQAHHVALVCGSLITAY